MPRGYNFLVYVVTKRNHSVLYIGVIRAPDRFKERLPPLHRIAVCVSDLSLAWFQRGIVDLIFRKRGCAPTELLARLPRQKSLNRCRDGPDRERRPFGSRPLEIVARVAPGGGERDCAIAAHRNYSSPRVMRVWPKMYRSLPRCSDSIRCSIRSAAIHVSRSSRTRTGNKLGRMTAVGPSTLRQTIVDLIFRRRVPRERVRSSLCQRQLLHQKPKQFQ